MSEIEDGMGFSGLAPTAEERRYETYEDTRRKIAQAREAQLATTIIERDRYRTALLEISRHWANQYDHPKKDTEMYRGPYGIGVTDGHRACKIIADGALNRAEGTK